MPRLRLSISSFIFAAVAIALAPANTSAQDAAKVAADAEKQIAAIQKLLARGKDVADKDNPLLTQLRVDGFKAVDDKVQVSGVFIDPGTKPNGDTESQVGDSARELILKHLGSDKQVAFTWKDVKTVGVVDDKGMPVGELAPHVALQNAANAAGAKGNITADQIRVDGSRAARSGPRAFRLRVDPTWRSSTASGPWIVDRPIVGPFLA